MIIAGSLPRRYARALIEIALEFKSENFLDLFEQNLATLEKMILSAPEFIQTLSNDLLDYQQRLHAAEEIAQQAGVHSHIKNFLLILVKKERFQILPEVIREFRKLRDEIVGILRVTVVEAQESDPALLKNIEVILAQRFKKQVVATGENRPQMIGGLILKIGNLIYDGSIKRELEQIKRAMLAG